MRHDGDMYAAFIERCGAPDLIRYGEIPAPVPGPPAVLVDVAATSVNPVDTFVRSGLFPTEMSFPFVIGRDLVGTVSAAGSEVRGFRAGERVWCNSLGHGGRQGAAAEQVVVPADRLYPLPAGVDPYHAVTAVHPAGTAYLALFTHGRLRAGETVVVAGAAGNVGCAVVAMAARSGARVVATARTEDFALCRRLGAAEVVDYRADDQWELVRAVTPGGVDVYTDTSGRNDLERAVTLLAPRGRIVVLAGAASRPVLPAGELYMKDGSVTGFVISRARTDELAEAADVINAMLADGLLRPRATEALPLAAAGAVHQRMEDGELSGRRVVLTPPGGSRR